MTVNFSYPFSYIAMKTLLSIFLILRFIPFVIAAGEREMLVVVSEPGNPTYDLEFRRQAKAWQDIAEKGEIAATTIGLDPLPEGGDLPALEKSLRGFSKDGGDLWLVWIGHGSYDGRTANFNLRGDDIDSKAVATLLKPLTRRLVILNLFSASAPFLDALSGENRIIISSNRSPGQRNYSRFGEKLADAISSTDADLDLDGEVSLLEATLEASAKTEAFYTDSQRVVQEHSVIEDNADQLGTPTAAFKGFRAEMESDDSIPDGALTREIHFLKANPDPLSEEAREKRAQLELEIHQLHRSKKGIPEEKYFELLEELMLSMAGLYSGT